MDVHDDPRCCGKARHRPLHAVRLIRILAAICNHGATVPLYILSKVSMNALQSLAYLPASGEPTLGGDIGPVPWWSFSKTVLAIAALRLVDAGRLALDTPIAGQPFTLAQLLRHEAGLADYGGLARYHADVAAGTPPWPMAQFLAASDAQRLRFAPGQGWSYSNIGYHHVAQQIEQATGLGQGAALARQVFEPAGLVSARLARSPDDLVGVNMGAAPGYHPGWVCHGLVTGTVLDAARLLRALVTGQLLKPQTLAQMRRGRALPEHRSEIHPDPAYGLGLMLHAQHALDHPMGHSGEGPGSRIAVYAQGLEVCALWQSESVQSDAARETFKILASGQV